MAKVGVKKGHNLFSAVIFNNTMRRRSFSELTLPETSITEFKVCFYPHGVKPPNFRECVAPLGVDSKKPSATRERTYSQKSPHCVRLKLSTYCQEERIPCTKYIYEHLLYFYKNSSIFSQSICIYPTYTRLILNARSNEIERDFEK